MKIKQTKNIIAVAVVGLVGSLLVLTSPTYADCAGIKTSIINCTQSGDKAAGIEQTGVWGLLLLVINIMTAGVGVLAVAGIVYGSIMYATAGGNPEGVKKAITIIRNVVIGIIAYAFMYAALNFIVPGGLFT
jgi:hypothetical protein